MMYEENTLIDDFEELFEEFEYSCFLLLGLPSFGGFSGGGEVFIIICTVAVRIVILDHHVLRVLVVYFF